MTKKTRQTRLTVILSTALMTPVAQGFEFEEFQSIPTQGANEKIPIGSNLG